MVSTTYLKYDGEPAGIWRPSLGKIFECIESRAFLMAPNDTATITFITVITATHVKDQ